MVSKNSKNRQSIGKSDAKWKSATLPVSTNPSSISKNEEPTLPDLLVKEKVIIEEIRKKLNSKDDVDTLHQAIGILQTFTASMKQKRSKLWNTPGEEMESARAATTNSIASIIEVVRAVERAVDKLSDKEETDRLEIELWKRAIRIESGITADMLRCHNHILKTILDKNESIEKSDVQAELNLEGLRSLDNALTTTQQASHTGNNRLIAWILESTEKKFREKLRADVRFAISLTNSKMQMELLIRKLRNENGTSEALEKESNESSDKRKREESVDPKNTEERVKVDAPKLFLNASDQSKSVVTKKSTLDNISNTSETECKIHEQRKRQLEEDMNSAPVKKSTPPVTVAPISSSSSNVNMDKLTAIRESNGSDGDAVISHKGQSKSVVTKKSTLKNISNTSETECKIHEQRKRQLEEDVNSAPVKKSTKIPKPADQSNQDSIITQFPAANTANHRGSIVNKKPDEVQMKDKPRLPEQSQDEQNSNKLAYLIADLSVPKDSEKSSKSSKSPNAEKSMTNGIENRSHVMSIAEFFGSPAPKARASIVDKDSAGNGTVKRVAPMFKPPSKSSNVPEKAVESRKRVSQAAGDKADPKKKCVRFNVPEPAAGEKEKPTKVSELVKELVYFLEFDELIHWASDGKSFFVMSSDKREVSVWIPNFRHQLKDHGFEFVEDEIQLTARHKWFVKNEPINFIKIQSNRKKMIGGAKVSKKNNNKGAGGGDAEKKK